MGKKGLQSIKLGKNSQARWDLQKQKPGEFTGNALQQNDIKGKTNIIELNVWYDKYHKDLKIFL